MSIREIEQFTRMLMELELVDMREQFDLWVKITNTPQGDS